MIFFPSSPTVHLWDDACHDTTMWNNIFEKEKKHLQGISCDVHCTSCLFCVQFLCEALRCFLCVKAHCHQLQMNLLFYLYFFPSFLSFWLSVYPALKKFTQSRAIPSARIQTHRGYEHLRPHLRSQSVTQLLAIYSWIRSTRVPDSDFNVFTGAYFGCERSIRKLQIKIARVMVAQTRATKNAWKQ